MMVGVSRSKGSGEITVLMWCKGDKKCRRDRKCYRSMRQSDILRESQILIMTTMKGFKKFKMNGMELPMVAQTT